MGITRYVVAYIKLSLDFAKLRDVNNISNPLKENQEVVHTRYLPDLSRGNFTRRQETQVS